MTAYDKLDAWIDQHFDEEVRALQALVQVPTDTPPGNNAPHAERTAELLAAMGLQAEKHPVPAWALEEYGLQSITNLIVRRRFGDGGRTIALNAHGDVVPPGEGWTHAPYGAEIEDGKLYGRASAVSKSDFATYVFATRALETLRPQLAGGVELYFTYDEEFGGTLGPGLGPVHAEVADTLLVISRICEAQRKWEAAIKTLRQRAEVVTRLYGSRSYRTTKASRDIRQCCQRAAEDPIAEYRPGRAEGDRRQPESIPHPALTRTVQPRGGNEVRSNSKPGAGNIPPGRNNTQGSKRTGGLG